MDSGEPLAAEEQQATFGDLFRYLVGEYGEEIRLTASNQTQLAKKISDRLKKNSMALGYRTILKQLLTGEQYQAPNTHTRTCLTSLIVEELRDRLPGINSAWLDESTLGALKRRIKRAEKAHAERNIAASGESVVQFRIPTRRPIMEQLRTELCHHYVCYRFALERVSGTGQNLVAREVITFSESGDNIEFLMSFRIGTNDGNPQELFRGQVMPLGQSLLCVGVHVDPVGIEDRDRGRTLFMHRNTFVDENARFGIMTTTRAEGGFEPCAACILLFRVQGSIDHEIHDFRQKVTIIRPLQAIFKSEFSTLSNKWRSDLETFLDNRPRREKGQTGDIVLKLWHNRFERGVLPILYELYNNDRVKAPFKANWRETRLLAI